MATQTAVPMHGPMTTDPAEIHRLAVNRALARRGLTLDEYRADMARRQVGAAEAASDAEAAHRRRQVGDANLATEDGQVRRGQWIEATSKILTTTLRRTSHLLPYAEAQDMAAEVLAAELEAAQEAGKPGHVRAERLTYAYLKLTAQTWRRDREAKRMDELSTAGTEAEDLAAEVPSMGAEAEAEAEAADDIGATYRQAADLARRLYLVADLPVVANLAQGLSDLSAAELAAGWGLHLSAWKRQAAQGGREVAASYPDSRDLAARVLPADFSSTWRQTPLEARRLGADLPTVRTNRTAAQAAREADVLIARPQLPGRKPGASKRTDGTWRTPPAPVQWETVRPLSAADLAAPLRRLLAAREAAQAPRSGPRTGRQASALKVTLRVPQAPPAQRPIGLPEVRRGTAAEVLAHLKAAEAELDNLGLLATWAGAEVSRADRPQLPTWQAGAARRPRPRQAPHKPASLEAAQAAELASYRPSSARPYLAAQGASEAAQDRAQRRLWYLVFNVRPDRRQAYRQAPLASLTVWTHEDYLKDSEVPFRSVAEMAAEAAEAA
jgi:hypothetical protein